MASLATSAKPPRLVLHFDVNETIMVADPAGGDSFEDVLNKMICKTAFVKRRDGGDVEEATSPDELEWRDGVPLYDDCDAESALWLTWDKPTDDSRMASTTPCLEKYRKTFTETVGKRFAGSSPRP